MNLAVAIMMKMRPFHRLAVLGVFCSVLMACEVTDDSNPFYSPKVVVPACPKVRLLQDADKVTVYRPGPGRDITDILYEARLEGFSGDCEYVGDGGVFHEVVLSLRAKFNLVRGPADSATTGRGRSITLAAARLFTVSGRA